MVLESVQFPTRISTTLGAFKDPANSERWQIGFKRHQVTDVVSRCGVRDAFEPFSRSRLHTGLAMFERYISRTCGPDPAKALKRAPHKEIRPAQRVIKKMEFKKLML